MLCQKPTSANWYIVLWESGKLRWYASGTASKADALTLHDEMMSQRREKKRQARVSFLLGGKAQVIKKQKPLLLSDAWKKYTEVNPKWSDAGRKIFNHFCEWSGDKDISEIDSDAALEYLKPYRKGNGKTFNNYKTALSMIWKHLTQYSNIERNIWREVASMGTSSDFYRPFTDEEYAKILKSTKGFWHDATVIAWYTGLRRKDIQLLQWSQIKEDHIELVPAKTSANQKSVFIPLHSEVKKILPKRKGKYVFPVEAGKLTNGPFNREYGFILAELGITAKKPAIVGFHSLRSSFITRCAVAGIDNRTIQGIAGQGSDRITNRYNHDTESAKAILALE